MKCLLPDSVGLTAPKDGQWIVYVLLCDNDSFYIGVTLNLKKRWLEHQSGGGARWTQLHRPLEIIHCEEHDSQEAAYKREKELKTGFGRKMVEKIIGWPPKTDKCIRCLPRES
jgi:predicted GIY-YIG superfamily endonuclease